MDRIGPPWKIRKGLPHVHIRFLNKFKALVIGYVNVYLNHASSILRMLAWL